ncbi:MAG: hypothetical protein V5A55_08240 [Halovenus sp.]
MALLRSVVGISPGRSVAVVTDGIGGHQRGVERIALVSFVASPGDSRPIEGPLLDEAP